MAVTRQGTVERRGDNPKEVERRESYLCLQEWVLQVSFTLLLLT
jgi:hypothetical protein